MVPRLLAPPKPPERRPAAPRKAPAAPSSASERVAKSAAKGAKRPPRRSQPGARRKATRFEARLTDAQKALFQEAAELRGQTLTEFVVRAGEEAAARVLERSGVLVLSTRDSAIFVDALLNPPAPNARLLAAAERYHADRAAARNAEPKPRRRRRAAGG